jgi:hypothetical protein
VTGLAAVRRCGSGHAVSGRGYRGQRLTPGGQHHDEPEVQRTRGVRILSTASQNPTARSHLADHNDAHRAGERSAFVDTAEAQPADASTSSSLIGT